MDYNLIIIIIMNDEKNEIGFQGIYRVPKKVFKNLKATNDSIARSTEGKHMKNNEETFYFYQIIYQCRMA